MDKPEQFKKTKQNKTKKHDDADAAAVEYHHCIILYATDSLVIYSLDYTIKKSLAF